MESVNRGSNRHDFDILHLLNVANVVQNSERDYCTNRSPSGWPQLEGMSAKGGREVKGETSPSHRLLR